LTRLCAEFFFRESHRRRREAEGQQEGDGGETPVTTDAPKYFFSYARSDSEFVLHLARELRAAGAGIWVDQLDILGGERWDQAIERALRSCQGMIVVLSPESVSSDNVMDEVSFALEAKKLIVPVIKAECEVPFRLRRLQDVKFTSDFHAGFAELLKALRIQRASQPDAGSSIGEVPTTKPSANPESVSASAVVRRPLESDRGAQVSVTPSDRRSTPNVGGKPQREETAKSFVAPIESANLRGEHESANKHRELPARFLNPVEYDAEYILIPGGRYEYSVTKKQAEVPSLYFAKYPVTNKQYRTFIQYIRGESVPEAEVLPLDTFAQSLITVANEQMLDAIGHKQRRWVETFLSAENDNERFNGDDQPVVAISWYAAIAYCDWLTQIAGRTDATEKSPFRLPKEVEWEWAASRGNRRYPWGDTEPDEKLANYGQKLQQTTRVDTYPAGATPEGLMDMAGNVEEWMEDWYDRSLVVTRGGAWIGQSKFDLCCDERGKYVPQGLFHIGFRVVRSVDAIGDPCARRSA
jgi:formylglycine-generating enzyme required for sulfatase activity